MNAVIISRLGNIALVTIQIEQSPNKRIISTPRNNWGGRKTTWGASPRVLVEKRKKKQK